MAWRGMAEALLISSITARRISFSIIDWRTDRTHVAGLKSFHARFFGRADSSVHQHCLKREEFRDGQVDFN